MRGICRLCGRKITENRSSHLKNVHGILPYKGAVKEYFDTPEDHDIPKDIFDSIPEGAKVFTEISIIGKLDNPNDFKSFKH